MKLGDLAVFHKGHPGFMGPCIDDEFISHKSSA
jgi:hypothetical protein